MSDAARTVSYRCGCCGQTITAQDEDYRVDGRRACTRCWNDANPKHRSPSETNERYYPSTNPRPQMGTIQVLTYSHQASDGTLRLLRFGKQISRRFAASRRAWIAGLSAILMFLACLFVWPTLYRFDKSGSTIIRINRVTGTAFKLTAYGWSEMTPPQLLPPVFVDPVPTTINVSQINGLTWSAGEFVGASGGYQPLVTIKCSNRSNETIHGLEAVLLTADGRSFIQNWQHKCRILPGSDADEILTLDNYPLTGSGTVTLTAVVVHR